MPDVEILIDRIASLRKELAQFQAASMFTDLTARPDEPSRDIEIAIKGEIVELRREVIEQLE